jgi:carboxypeptidase C (cathepsin A)
MCHECPLSAAISYLDHMTRFIFATESYGGHYGPSFVTYFEEQNALTASGAIEGEPIVVSALMINK